MFKKANFSEEIASAMEEIQAEAFSDKTEDKHKLAIAYLMDAAEYFDLAGMEKEAEITTRIIQKFASTYDPKMVSAPNTFGPKKIYDAKELFSPDQKLRSDYIDPTPIEEPKHEPFEKKFLSEQNLPLQKAPISPHDAKKLLRKHERMARFFESDPNPDSDKKLEALKEYVPAILYLQTVVDGRPRPDIYNKFDQPHVPQWVSDIALLPRDKLAQVFREHLNSAGINPVELEKTFRRNYPQFRVNPEEMGKVTAVVSPVDATEKQWVVEFSTGETSKHKSKEEAVLAAASRVQTKNIQVLNRVLPVARLPLSAGRGADKI